MAAKQIPRHNFEPSKLGSEAAATLCEGTVDLVDILTSGSKLWNQAFPYSKTLLWIMQTFLGAQRLDDRKARQPSRYATIPGMQIRNLEGRFHVGETSGNVRSTKS